LEQIAEQPASPILKPKIRREPLELVFAGLLVFLVIYFIRPEDWIPGLEIIHPARAVGLLTLVALVFSFQQVRWHLPREILFLILLVAQFWLSAPFSPVWKTGAFNYAVGFTRVVPLVLVMYLTIRSMKRLRVVLLVQAVCVAAVAVASIIAGTRENGRLQGAVAGIFGNSNDLALIIDLSLPICLAFALTAKFPWKKLVWAVVMILMTFAVLLTASRAGALALVVAALFCLWRLGIGGRGFHLLLLVPLALVAVWIFAGKSLEQRFEKTNIDAAAGAKTNEASESADQRHQLFLESLRVTAQHPFLGVGAGNFSITSGVWRVTHNTFTQVSSEGGVPALIFYLLILGCGVANLRAVRKRRAAGKEARLLSMALEATLAAYLVGSFFASVAYELFPYCVVAYTTALNLIVTRTQTESRPAAEAPPPDLVPVEDAVWE
jgi:putative inorganic carbon (hco3(-)) transporter